MVRYFYAWTPLVIVGTVVVLSLPWLAPIALMIVSFVALATLASAIISVPYVLSRAMSRRWQGRSVPSPRTAAALSPANPGVRRSRSVPTGATVLLANRRSESDS
jgi:hypothetical protein